MKLKPVLVIQGEKGIDVVPRLDELSEQAELRFASTAAELRNALPGADVLLGWNFRAGLQEVWGSASDLRWVLGMIICFAKEIPQNLEFQARAEWKHRVTEMVAGKRALIVGVGSIGRAVGRLLRAAGMEVEAIGRSARDGDVDFGHIYAIDELHERLSSADYVVLITPLTEQTRNLFGAAEFAAMATHARFINIGRGPLVVEADLLEALHSGQIAGAALDVFVEEPLPKESPFWRAPNCLVSPHMSGDYAEYEAAMADQFMANWARYLVGEPLLNVVDKKLGFVPGST